MEWNKCEYRLVIWMNSHLLKHVTKPEYHRSEKSNEGHSKTVLLLIDLVSKYFTLRNVFKLPSTCYKNMENKTL